MDSKNDWGNPGPNSSLSDWKNYSDQILNTKENHDLIMIDGRFRVACCLKCFDKIGESEFIIFDDFLNRKHYHIILDYYEIVEKTQADRMVILKKKKCNSPSKEIIENYEKDKR